MVLRLPEFPRFPHSPFSIFNFRFLIALLFCAPLLAQPLRPPLDIPLVLSGNFGELRNNHFHAGLDFKTQGVEGKAIHTVLDGYICRIVVSPWGYGNAIYVSHGDSSLTLYGHLQRFDSKIAFYVQSKQYEKESFAVDLSLTPEAFPVKSGDIIGYSGNSGSSGGPHLHFEIRDNQSGEVFDPLPNYLDKITDNRPPRVKALMVYPIENEGVVNDSQRKRRFQPVTSKDGKQTITEKIEAWGKIAFSINIDDYMDGTVNVYGVKELIMFVDSQKVFHRTLDRFSFDETRYLNACVDFEEWKEKRSFFTKTFVEPGNRIRFITSKNRGYVTINETRTYHVTFQLIDTYGNESWLSVVVTGKEQPVLPSDTMNTTLFYWNGENQFGAKGIRLFVPRGSLYNYLYFRHRSIVDSPYLSDIQMLHDKPVALHKPAQLSLRISVDTLSEKRQYGVVMIVNKRNHWIGGKYRDGWMDADINELGTYAVMADTVPPNITPLDQQQWMKKGVISFRLTDTLSGISSYRGEIDGNYALFEMDGKNALVTYTLDKERLSRGKHSLSLAVKDACGNQTIHETTFVY
ncbi:MAG: M23 family metallopeptidase [Tannerella sp.]|jgi:hypothetical protein|nr:M23 family metallopeptidase [Tannerella sp.]